MVFEFNIIYNLIKTHLAGLSALIDTIIICYLIWAKRENNRLKEELSKKASKEDLDILKEYITKAFKHETNNIRSCTQVYAETFDKRIEDIQLFIYQRIDDIKENVEKSLKDIKLSISQLNLRNDLSQ